MTDDEREMGQMVTYRSEGMEDMNVVLDHVPRKVTIPMNDQLVKDFSEEEVKCALFQMFPTKAPGPNRFPAQFFQRH